MLIMTASSSAWRGQLLGVWKLLSVELINEEDQPIAQPMGPNRLGRLAFSPEGYVSVLLMNPDLGREAFKDGVPWRQATDTNIATVARLATSYSGPFRFSSDAGTPTLITKVEVTLDPNWIEQIKRGNSAFGKRAQKGSCPGAGEICSSSGKSQFIEEVGNLS